MSKSNNEPPPLEAPPSGISMPDIQRRRQELLKDVNDILAQLGRMESKILDVRAHGLAMKTLLERGTAVR